MIGATYPVPVLTLAGARILPGNQVGSVASSIPIFAG